MLKFAFKNMATKKAQIILIVISIVISASVAVLAFNVSNQVSDELLKMQATIQQSLVLLEAKLSLL